jgi:hypothetical protein
MRSTRTAFAGAAGVAALAVVVALTGGCQVLLPFGDPASDAGPGAEGGAFDGSLDARGNEGGPGSDSAAPPSDASRDVVDASSDTSVGPQPEAGCEAGSCTPEVLASNQSVPQYLKLSGGTLYWTTDDDGAKAGVWHVPAGGGTASTVTLDSWLYDLAVAGQDVYWAATDGVATYGDAGRTLFVGNTHPQAMTTDGTNLYWSDWGTGKPIYAQPLGVSAASPGTALYTNTGTVFSIAVFQGNLYWTVNDTSVTDGLVQFGAIGGGQPTTAAQNQANPVGVSVDSSGVYWANEGTIGAPGGGSDQTVWAQPAGGGAAIPLGSGLNHPVKVWADPSGPYVYWVEQGDPGDGYKDGTVRRRKKDGSDVVVTMAGGQQQPFDITGDATSIYWLNAGAVADDGGATESGQVMRLPK